MTQEAMDRIVAAAQAMKAGAQLATGPLKDWIRVNAHLLGSQGVATTAMPLSRGRHPNFQ